MRKTLVTTVGTILVIILGCSGITEEPISERELNPATQPVEPTAPDPAPIPPSAPTAQNIAEGGLGLSSGSVSKAAPFSQSITVGEAGLLTAAVRSGAAIDLVLSIADVDGQTVYDGRSDGDVGGNRAAEQLVATIPSAGTYQVWVEVRSWGDETVGFSLSTSWAPFPALGQAEDSDGRPGRAINATIGTELSGSIDPSSGDHWDWYVFESPNAGSLTVLTRAPEGDIKLESFDNAAFRKETESADDDLQDVRGNESITLQVRANTPYYFRVRAVSSSAEFFTYTINSGFIPRKPIGRSESTLSVCIYDLIWPSCWTA